MPHDYFWAITRTVWCQYYFHTVRAKHQGTVSTPSHSRLFSTPFSRNDATTVTRTGHFLTCGKIAPKQSVRPPAAPAASYRQSRSVTISTDTRTYESARHSPCAGTRSPTCWRGVFAPIPYTYIYIFVLVHFSQGDLHGLLTAA